MAEVHSEVAGEDRSGSVARAVWGLLMVWIGAVLLFQWGWGIGFVGAGAILLGAQVVRRSLQLRVDGFALVVGAVFVICGAGSLFQVAVDLFPVLCIVAGLALLASIWTARRRQASGEPTDLRAPTQPRA